MPNPITAGYLRKLLENVPDDVRILFNVEEADNENWDTTDVGGWNDSYLCYGEEGCTHTEPEMYWDIVILVRHPTLGDESITLDPT